MMASERHRAKVERIAGQLRAHRGGPVSLRKKAVPHQVPKRHDLRRRDAKIDVSDLTEILSIDPVSRTCVAESGVTFVDLVAATLAHGLIPIVVPELKTITIGGAIAGCSIESMSFVHGGFHDTCLAYEVITGTGDVLTCTPDNEHRLIFQMVHGTFGTLGIIAALTFRLIPAKPFVHLRYETYGSLADYQAAIQRVFDERNVDERSEAMGGGSPAGSAGRAGGKSPRGRIDFMDGMIHSPSCYVLCLGTMTGSAPYTSNYSWMKIYYLSTRTRSEDYLTITDYFFRYDRGVTNVRPSSWLGRLVLGKLLSSTQWLWLGNKLRWVLRSERPPVTLDVFVPFSRVGELLSWHEREFGFYPLWCVPYRRVHDYEWLTDAYWAGVTDALFLDIAIYGMRQPTGANAYRMIEDQLREVGGMKTLISHNYYSEAEFWAIWNKPNYQAVKAITDPNNAFRDLYTKTCKTVMGQT